MFKIDTKIKSRINELNRKNLILISDFDDTLAVDYEFDKLRATHIPQLDKKLEGLLKELSLSNIPLYITTSRGAQDKRVLRIISNLTSKPIIIESGAALFDNGKISSLLNKQQEESIKQLKKKIKKLQPNLKHLSSKQTECLIRMNRISGIEIRLQDRKGKSGSDKIKKEYTQILKFLKSKLKEISDQFNFEINESSLIIIVKGVNKGKAVKLLLSNENSLDKHKLVFGDSISDSALMKISDLGISVGRKKLEHADFHLPGNNRSVSKILKLI